jgi:hypothetical protein
MIRSCLLFYLLFHVAYLDAQSRKTENVIIVTLDGFRWREVFGGADRKILCKERFVDDTTVISRFNATTAAERRKKLLPFFWEVIAREGQLYGNRKYGNRMKLQNMNLYSYAGYSEMFVGFADPRVRSNKPVPNPNGTVLEAINNHNDFEGEVAVFSTWNVMPLILRREQSGIHVNSGGDKAVAADISEYEKTLNFLTDEIENPHGDRYDNFTFQYAMEYLKRKRPRVLFISFDETDEHGHGGRYDRYLDAAHRADRMIAELWAWIQSQDDYRNKTTLLIGTDHGRGTSPKGWQRHALLFRGSAQVWLAAIGPDTPPSGEMKSRMRLGQNQIAQTIAMLLGVPYNHEKPTGDPILTLFQDADFESEPTLTLGGSGQ